MTAHALATTAEELWHLPDDGMRHELVEGQLRVMAPAGFEHGRVSSTANRLLANHVHATGTGVTLGAETGFILASHPDTVRAPDAAFVSNARAEAVGRTVRFWPGGAPDLAIEVVSPDDSRPEVRSKALCWLDAGASAVLILDPALRSARVFRAGGDIRVVTEGEIDLDDAVPGWRVAVADFFA